MDRRRERSYVRSVQFEDTCLRGTSSTDAALLHVVLAGCDFAPVDKWFFLARSLRRLHSHFLSILFGDFGFSSRNFLGRHSYPWPLAVHIRIQTSGGKLRALVFNMPRQKLTRKPPQTPGRRGQVQPRGPHDPEHQSGRSPQREDNVPSKPGKVRHK